MVLIKFLIIFHGDYEDCPCFNFIQGPLTSVRAPSQNRPETAEDFCHHERALRHNRCGHSQACAVRKGN